MSNSNINKKVEPFVLRGKIDLPNVRIVIGKNAVESSGRKTSSQDIIKNLKRAAKKGIFPPLVSTQ